MKTNSITNVPNCRFSNSFNISIWKYLNLQLIITLLITGIFVNGCKKEDRIVPNQWKVETNFNSLKSLYINNEDIEDQIINENLLLTALSFNNVMKNIRIRNFILYELNKDRKSQGISLVDLSLKNNEFAELLAAELHRNLLNQDLPDHLKSLVDLPKEEIIGHLESMMVHQNENYLLVVYRNKFDDQAKIKPRDGGYITAIAADITDNDYDEILAFVDQDTFLMNEEFANTTEETIVFVGDGAREQINIDIPESDPKISNRDNEILIEVDTWRIQSGHRYDSDKYSEVILYMLLFDDDERVIEAYASQDFCPKKVHKNDIDNMAGGTTFTVDQDYFNANQGDFNSGLNVHVGAFEYDWYASYKNLTPTCGDFPGPTAPTAACRMKFSNEWYFFLCLDVPTWWPSVPSSFTVPSSNVKCDFVFKRITP